MLFWRTRNTSLPIEQLHEVLSCSSFLTTHTCFLGVHQRHMPHQLAHRAAKGRRALIRVRQRKGELPGVEIFALCMHSGHAGYVGVGFCHHFVPSHLHQYGPSPSVQHASWLCMHITFAIAPEHMGPECAGGCLRFANALLYASPYQKDVYWCITIRAMHGPMPRTYRFAAELEHLGQDLVLVKKLVCDRGPVNIIVNPAAPKN